MLIVTIVLAGCGGDPLDDRGFFSDFIFENASNYTVEAEFSTPFSSDSDASPIQVDADDSQVFHTAFNLTQDIANALTPTDTFSVINVYAVVDGQLIPTVEPISDTRWV